MSGSSVAEVTARPLDMPGVRFGVWWRVGVWRVGVPAGEPRANGEAAVIGVRDGVPRPRPSPSPPSAASASPTPFSAAARAASRSSAAAPSPAPPLALPPGLPRTTLPPRTPAGAAPRSNELSS